MKDDGQSIADIRRRRFIQVLEVRLRDGITGSSCRSVLVAREGVEEAVEFVEVACKSAL